MVEKLRPLHDRVLLKRVEEEEKTAGGIIIPDTAKDKGQMARVIAVGPGRITAEGNLVPMHVKKGDTVFFSKYAGVEVGKDEYLIVREDEILGVVGQ